MPMLDRKSVHHMVQERLSILQKGDHEQAFIQDVNRLMDIDSDQSLPGINASVWLDQIAALSDDTLARYARAYHPGLLDPFRGTSFDT